MGLSTFIGGVHPYEGKELSADKPIQVIQPKGELVYPLSQHIGAPAKPLVAKGDKVLVGQKIAEAGGFISANVICSVSGTVKGIEPRLVANGAIVQSIIVENDNEYTAIEGFGEKRDYTKLSKEEIRNIVKEAGIVGLGGAGFPTNVKLAPKDDNAIDHIIVNAAECEPYLTSDHRIMVENADQSHVKHVPEREGRDRNRGEQAGGDQASGRSRKRRAKDHGMSVKDKVSAGRRAFPDLCGYGRTRDQLHYASGGCRMYRR